MKVGYCTESSFNSVWHLISIYYMLSLINDFTAAWEVLAFLSRIFLQFFMIDREETCSLGFYVSLLYIGN